MENFVSWDELEVMVRRKNEECLALSINLINTLRTMGKENEELKARLEKLKKTE